jgi:hypothetical protein
MMTLLFLLLTSGAMVLWRTGGGRAWQGYLSSQRRGPQSL